MISISFEFIYIALIRLGLSVLCSFIISIEREMHTHPGGICTHTLVGLGSCLFTMISVHFSSMYPSTGADPARICAQVVSGMGFLGSATIFKNNNYVKGINTAANLWISAAVSMSIGAGLWEFGVLNALFTFIVLIIKNKNKKCVYANYKKTDIPGDIELGQNVRDPLDAPYGDENDSDIIRD